MVGLMVTSSKKAYATCCVTLVRCIQSPCPCSRPQLTCTCIGDTQTLKGRSGSVSVGSLGPCEQKVLFEPSEGLWWVWSLILNVILYLYHLAGAFPLPFGVGYLFLGGIKHSPVYGGSALSCNFGVIPGEDECTFFHFTILFPVFIDMFLLFYNCKFIF